MRIKQVFASYDRNEHQPADQFRYCPLCRTPLHLEESGHRLRPTCISCGFVQFKNPAPTVSVLIVEGDRVLLGKRGGSPGKTKWSIPSGYVEYEDDFLTTAIREVKEETGLDVEIQSLLNVVSSFLSPQFHFLAVYLLAHVVDGELRAGDDLVEVEWFSLSEPLPDMAFVEDVATLELYAAKKCTGLPVDPDFAQPGLR